MLPFVVPPIVLIIGLLNVYSSAPAYFSGKEYGILVAGYVVEGHVPVRDVQRLLNERPALAGIGVPGMPIGSPGMEVAGMKPQAYDVIAFAKDGSTRVFASHNK